MRKLAAVVVLLALPALVAADINRLKLSPDLDRADALPWNARRTEPNLMAWSVGLPVWAGPSVPLVSRFSKSEFRCPCTVPQHVVRCQCNPGRPDRTGVPVFRPHSARTRDDKTTAKEQHLGQGRVQDGRSAD